ncbi:hypothetical protein DB88DRAFT_472973 [Papiliotrema laurentii]|uniref:Uncharacterized protein n=1 Tax=Papiliotrema laurentii TaxID=5418 RepID=A0AAD9FQT7_PAPLA|nr:hypothetical protein DB88DRAFT_472973 [Papiliotrema laurentii]
MSSPGWNVLVVSPGGMTSRLPQRSSPNNLAFHPSFPTHTYLPSPHLASTHLPTLSPLTLFFTPQTPPQHQSSLTMGISAIATSVGSCFADTIKSSCGFATRHPWMTTAAALATAGALYRWWTNPSRGTRIKQRSPPSSTAAPNNTKAATGSVAPSTAGPVPGADSIKTAPAASTSAGQGASTTEGNPQATTRSVAPETAETKSPGDETPGSVALSAPVTDEETGDPEKKNGAATTDNSGPRAPASVVTEPKTTGDNTEGDAEATERNAADAATWPWWLWQKLSGSRPVKQPSESVESPSKSVPPPPPAVV